MNEMSVPTQTCGGAVFPLVRLPIALIIVIAVGGAASAGGFGPRKNADEANPRLGPLVNVITSTIKPATWAEAGGPGTIRAVDAWGMIVVSQTSDVHERIAWLLKGVRQARRYQERGADEPSKDQGIDEAKHSISFVAESSTEACSRRRIETILSSETELEFEETALSDVAKCIQEQHQLPVILDQVSLEDLGIEPEMHMTADLKGISLRSALRIILDQLELTYVVQSEVLQITTREKAESHLVTRIYPVDDLAVVANATASNNESNGKAAE